MHDAEKNTPVKKNWLMRVMMEKNGCSSLIAGEVIRHVTLHVTTRQVHSMHASREKTHEKKDEREEENRRWNNTAGGKNPRVSIENGGDIRRQCSSNKAFLNRT